MCKKNSNVLEQKWLILFVCFLKFLLLFYFRCACCFLFCFIQNGKLESLQSIKPFKTKFCEMCIAHNNNSSELAWVCKKQPTYTDWIQMSAPHHCRTSTNLQYSFCKGISFRVGHNFLKAFFFQMIKQTNSSSSHK